VKGQWEPICEPGFGDPCNIGIFELEVFDNHLYAGTVNPSEGFQIWKAPLTGNGPCRWSKVIEHGAYKGAFNEIAMSMCVFDDVLCVGAGLPNGGYDRTYGIGPAAAELLFIYPNDSWDLVVGTPRYTPQGLKVPLSGMGPGFDNFFNGYIWRMTVHDGWLYVGTFDWSVFLTYAQMQRMSPWLRRHVGWHGIDTLLKYDGGFDLWRTRDGIRWNAVTRTGFGNPYNYGARTLVSSPFGLLVGTANPFGPQVATRLASGWLYVSNPQGGMEIWLGR